MVLWKVSLRRFPWNHGKVLTQKSGPGIAPEARSARRGVHPPAPPSSSILSQQSPLSNCGSDLLVQEFSFADAIGGSGGRLKKRTRRRASADGNAEPDQALPRCKIEIPCRRMTALMQRCSALHATLNSRMISCNGVNAWPADHAIPAS